MCCGTYQIAMDFNVGSTCWPLQWSTIGTEGLLSFVASFLVVWYMRADVRRSCRGCLSCVYRRGPGRTVCSPLQPIPVLKPFHRVDVNVLQLPLTSSGNKYVVAFMDYFTKWVEACTVADQQALTIARLLLENIVCRHGVPQNYFQIKVLTSFRS